ncbi:hypothetical protein [Hungatella sp.]|jgi:predicted MFS family arabinose efflux permease|uniref:hypothetical protein n=1 Tax=Hungatella sp. TaxID=2613924 RepID=UPI002A82F6A5|nr:hypothetical protein [Hungatella sp.]
MQANSLIDVISSLANMAGPVIGGILFSVVGLVPILCVSSGCLQGFCLRSLSRRQYRH